MDKNVKKLSDRELELLLTGLESDRVERKEKFESGGQIAKKIRQAVCAFSNDLPNNNQPGILFIGAKDDGTSSGLDVTEELLSSLADIKTDGNILPLPVLSVEKKILNGGELAVVTVEPSDMPPVRYDGRIWVRTGSRRSIASEQDERNLIEKRRYKNIPFDIYPLASAKLSDLSKNIFENEYLPAAFARDILESNGRGYEERLASCKMIVSPQDTTPTILGLLTIGKNPQDYLPGAYIQFLRIFGNELFDPVIDEEKINGTLADMLRRIGEKLNAHNRTAVDITSSSTHKQYISYPQAAIEQILYNAVLHRTYERTNSPIRVYWYNDRIEIISPGGPYGNVTMNNFGQPGVTDYRNPNIADVLKTFGFIQAVGRGIAIAKSLMINNGNVEPEFTVNQDHVLCILRNCQ